MRAPTCYSEIW